MSMSPRTMRAVLFTGFMAAMTPLLAQAPAQGSATAPSDAQVRELEQQIKSLQQQLDELNATRDTAARQRLMQRNWQDMQDYMRGMHDRWGSGDPWMEGRGMMGCPMLGRDDGGWPVPGGMSPDQYRQRMRDHMQRIQEQMNKIAQTADPQERQRLMQEHWQSMYRDMQTMRGMGWMWGGGSMMGPGMMRRGMVPGGPAPSTEPLPDADSTGAKLVSTYCAQCHAAPQPALHTAKEWTSVIQRMRARMASGWQGIKAPSEQEMKTILTYMQQHAR